MAVVLIEINRKPQNVNCKTQTQTNTYKQQKKSEQKTNTAKTANAVKAATKNVSTPKKQNIKQVAAASAATELTKETKAKETPNDFLTAFSLLTVLGGVFLVSQYKGKKK